MNLSLFSLENKVAIVTGAGKGIGKSVALGLADAGASVVVTARTIADIKATAEEIKNKGVNSFAVPADVRVKDQVDHMVERAVKEFGRIDILINNAGGTFNASLDEIRENGWDAIFRENIKSVFLCTQAASRVMIDQKSGNIINIASRAGISAFPQNPAYGAAKAGIIHFTKTCAVDLAKYNIRVNCIAPGEIATQGVADLLGGSFWAIENQIPLGRMGQPDEIAGGVIYLASKASTYVTGTTIIIDGGELIKPSIIPPE